MEPSSAIAPLKPRPLRDDEVLNGEWVLTEFLAYVESCGLELYPAQEEAILEVSEGNNVILNTPTGSGKSLVATAACFAALSYGERAFYTAPIKALVSEKFLHLCRVFGPENVGMMTGDATVNHDAPIICCTAEILSNLALREGRRADLEWVVMDEFHYYSDRDRGVAWQVPLLSLPQARFLLMSATLGDTAFFQKELERLTGVKAALVRSTERPVPLDYSYAETPSHETISELFKQGKVPIYIVHFSQRAASEHAQSLTSFDFLSREQKQELRDELKGVKLDSAFGKELARFIPHGIGVHHAGMLPKYRLLVEKLAQKGLLKVVCGTDTLGVGVNIPLRTVLFTQLCKFDGDKVKILTVRDFQQIAGRAGRKGFDTAGSVVVQAPEHVVENLSSKRKAAGDPKKLRKLRLKKPPERGYAPWDATTLQRLRSSDPEPLVSRFSIGTSMMLNVLCRKEEDGCRAMKALIRGCHDSDQRKRAHGKSAIAVFRALVEADIVTMGNDGLSVNAELQEDFSLNHALSLYAVEVIEALDHEDRHYALVVLTVIEATLEDPGAILFRQVDTLKGRKILELKQQGVEYDERMNELDKVTYPKPEAEFLGGTYEIFSKKHPWVLSSQPRPKSIARDMYEMGLSFNGYVKEYGLSRAEGVVLRYLSEVYRALDRTVPDADKTEELRDVIEWLGGELSAVDDSLLEEWRRLSDPAAYLKSLAKPEEPKSITSDERAFTILLRNQIWRLVQALARRDYEGLSERLRAMGAGVVGWTADGLREASDAFFSEYELLRVDPVARNPRHLLIEKDGDNWSLRQILLDPEEDQSWSLVFDVDLSLCREHDRVVLTLKAVDSG